MAFQFQSPTRVDLAGGTLDCWPLYLFLKDQGIDRCLTLNLSIDIETSAHLEPRKDDIVEINVKDYNYTQQFSSWQDVMKSKNKELSLIKSVVDYWDPPSGFSLTTFSESPIGAGLGGSSSLTISLIKAFSAWKNKTLSLLDMVNLAHDLEAQYLLTPTGTQDYFPAIARGLNLIEYSAGQINHEILDVPLEIFESKMMVIYTGRPHHSGLNNFEVIKACVNKDKSVLSALGGIAEVAQDMYSALMKKNWDVLPELFNAEYAFRVKLSPSFTSPEIQKLSDHVLQEGAQAVKICGAGGGGCVIVWAPANCHSAIRNLCQKENWRVLEARVVT